MRLYRNKEWLENQYLGRENSQEKLRKALGCSQATIKNELQIHDIPERSREERDLLIKKSNENKSWGSPCQQLIKSFGRYF